MSREENFNSQHLTHTELSNVTVLMLSSGYEPLFRTNWRRAMGAVLGGRAEVIRNHDGITIGTVSGDYPLPAVVRFTHGVIAARIKKRYKSARLTKRNLYLRDSGRCQYCDASLNFYSSTVDHVNPKSRGGQHVWENVVLACSGCNQKKGSRLLKEVGMKLKKPLKIPTINFLLCSPVKHYRHRT